MLKTDLMDLNQYGHKAGVHTPEATIATLEALEKEFPMLSFVDASWHNDAADSLEVSNIKIQLPEGAGRGLEVNRFRIWMPEVEEGLPNFGIEEVDESEEQTQAEYDTLEALIAGIKVAILPIYALGETKVLPEIEDEDERMILVDGDPTSIREFIHANTDPNAGPIPYEDIATLCTLRVGQEAWLNFDTMINVTIKRTK